MRTTLAAGLLGGVVGGFPSTVHALFTSGDGLEAVDAVATVVGAAHLPSFLQLPIVGVVHMTISVLWAAALARILPKRNTVWFALAAGVVIAVVDLKVIAPMAFPAIAALEFWPQLADHLAWGACVGAVLAKGPVAEAATQQTPMSAFLFTAALFFASMA